MWLWSGRTICALAQTLHHYVCERGGTNGEKGKLKYLWFHLFSLLPSIFILCVFQLQRNICFCFISQALCLQDQLKKCNFKSQTKYLPSLPSIISVCQQKYTHKAIMFTYVHTASKPHCALQCGESFCIAGGNRRMGSERWETSQAYHFPFCASDSTLTEVREQISSSFSRFWNRL